MPTLAYQSYFDVPLPPTVRASVGGFETTQALQPVRSAQRRAAAWGPSEFSIPPQATPVPFLWGFEVQSMQPPQSMRPVQRGTAAAGRSQFGSFPPWVWGFEVQPMLPRSTHRDVYQSLFDSPPLVTIAPPFVAWGWEVQPPV